MRSILTLILVFSSAPLTAQLTEGDSHWSRRAEGHRGPRAQATRVDAAIGAYQRAIGDDPNSFEAHWKLLRAYRFKAAYGANGTEEKKRIYTQARKASEESLRVMDRKLAGKGLKSLSKASEKQIADRSRDISGAAELFYWDAAVWGEWALVYGKMAAVREGAADRIMRHSTIAMMIDPKAEGGGGARILGRLHNQTPRVPFVTGWASDKEAVKYLKQSVAVDPTNKVTQVWLAEAMVAANHAAKPQALEILRGVINSAIESDYPVEQAAAQDDARELIAKWGRK